MHKDCSKELTERQRVILELVEAEPTLTSQKIAQKISQKESVSERTIKSDIAILKKKGLLRREGGNKEGIWIVITKEQ